MSVSALFRGFMNFPTIQGIVSSLLFAYILVAMISGPILFLVWLTH